MQTLAAVFPHGWGRRPPCPAWNAVGRGPVCNVVEGVFPSERVWGGCPAP